MLNQKSIAGNRIYLGNKGEWLMGRFSSTADNKGLKLSSSRTSLHRVYGDTGSTALTAGVYRPSLSRMLIGTAFSAGVTACGSQSQIKVAASVTADYLAGMWGYAEIVAAKTVTGSITGVRGTVDLPSTAVIASGQVASAFLADSIDLGGTHTGVCAAFHVPNPLAGTWDAFAYFGSAPGFIDSGSTKSTPGGVDNWLIVSIAGTAHYIPMYHSKTA